MIIKHNGGKEEKVNNIRYIHLHKISNYISHTRSIIGKIKNTELSDVKRCTRWVKKFVNFLKNKQRQHRCQSDNYSQNEQLYVYNSAYEGQVSNSIISAFKHLIGSTIRPLVIYLAFGVKDTVHIYGYK